jgi:hypothetical protein
VCSIYDAITGESVIIVTYVEAVPQRHGLVRMLTELLRLRLRLWRAGYGFWKIRVGAPGGRR